jgi:hypothetical protein
MHPASCSSELKGRVWTEGINRHKENIMNSNSLTALIFTAGMLAVAVPHANAETGGNEGKELQAVQSAKCRGRGQSGEVQGRRHGFVGPDLRGVW